MHFRRTPIYPLNSILYDFIIIIHDWLCCSLYCNCYSNLGRKLAVVDMIRLDNSDLISKWNKHQAVSIVNDDAFFLVEHTISFNYNIRYGITELKVESNFEKWKF